MIIDGITELEKLIIFSIANFNVSSSQKVFFYISLASTVLVFSSQSIDKSNSLFCIISYRRKFSSIDGSIFPYLPRILGRICKIMLYTTILQIRIFRTYIMWQLPHMIHVKQYLDKFHECLLIYLALTIDGGKKELF